MTQQLKDTIAEAIRQAFEDTGYAYGGTECFAIDGVFDLNDTAQAVIDALGVGEEAAMARVCALRCAAVGDIPCWRIPDIGEKWKQCGEPQQDLTCRAIVRAALNIQEQSNE